MARVIHSNFWAVALLIRTELARFLEWDASNIHIVAGNVDVPYRTGEQDIVLRIQGEHPDGSTVDGGGRQVNRRTRDIGLEVRTRMLLDPTDEDLQRLTDESRGHLQLEDRVVDCLEDFFPVDAQGDCVVVQGLACGPFTDPSRDKKSPQWVTSILSVEVLYNRAFTRIGDV